MMMQNQSGLIECLECGKYFQVLHTHIRVAHQMDANKYLHKHPKAALISPSLIEKATLTSRSRFEKDPELRTKVAKRKFDFIQDKTLEALLARDFKDADSCLKNGLWKPALILYGSIIEAILMKETKSTSSMNFNDVVDIAFKNGYIAKNESYYIYLIKDLRNYVHIYKEKDAEISINEHVARAFSDICKLIIKRLTDVKR